MTALPNTRYVARKRRVTEDKRLAAGRGNFVQDIAMPGTLHVAVLASPHPRANIKAIDTSAALALPGVAYVLTGAELYAATNPLYGGLPTPEVKWLPLAVGMTRYAGEWVCAVAATSRAVAEDAIELIEVDYESLPCIVDPEEALKDGAPLVHPGHKSNVLYRRTFTWGPVADDFAKSEETLSFRARWNRSSTVPIETFGALARWDMGRDMLEVWASIQMPNYAEQIANALRIPLNAVRVHQDVDVGGSYGVKRGIKHTIIVGYLSRKLGGVPVRLIEDRFDNMSGGDAHGPDRIFDTTVAFDRDGTIRSMKVRAIDDAGAYPGRGPFQLGKPIAALCGPYTVNSIEYEAISVTTNKTGQVPVRGFGQSPTNFMIETMIDKVARHLGMDRLDIRRKNFIAPDAFPYEIPTGTKYDSGNYPVVLDKGVALADWQRLVARRDELRSRGRLAGIGIATCLEPGGGNNMFEYLMNPSAEITTFMEGCGIRIDGHGKITGVMGTTTSGQGHETLVATIMGEDLEREPDDIRVVHADSLAGLPTRSPVASRMAIMLGGAASGAARKIKDKLLKIAAHNLGKPESELEYNGGTIFDRADPARKLSWEQLCTIAHRQYHKLPAGMEPGLQAEYVWQVPRGGGLPDKDDKVQLYPCFSFQAHLALVDIDPDTGKVNILDYALAHDCGTVINPDIVRGMIIGGVAHGIGAALYEKFHYAPDGQFMSATFADYLIPSVFEVPFVKDIEHCTPSPLTSHGQKGSGEGGYLGAPACIASAVNDALAPRNLSLDSLPMRMMDIEALLNGDHPT